MTRKLNRRTFGKVLGTAATGLAVPAALSGSASAFSDGERVEATTNLNTREQPGTESPVVATVSPGEVGEIMNGPTTEDGYTWWGVHWLDRNVWGWSVERYLASTSSAETDIVWPMDGYITSPYGQRSSGFHGGVDIGHNGEIGTPIYAARAGTAYTAYDSGGYGNYVYIVHGNGYETEYGHVNSFAISDGQSVSRGQHIAGMGDSGNSTGPHLHFGIEQNNDPKPIPGSDGQTVNAGGAISRDYSGL
ncbi:M23 family metallopeptidase [Haladaptatus halobius]|uniref:M23 family metallopeptidase n=1 Tax=Haladaptatus halobius TaxID=2884875 RepID=UPI001D09B60E|nr:M23 family metallopeptidase [Haladaptatus halobius]